MHTLKTKSGGRSCLRKKRGSDKATITISQPCALLLSHLKAGLGQENLSVCALHMCQEMQSVWWERRQKNPEHRRTDDTFMLLSCNASLQNVKEYYFLSERNRTLSAGARQQFPSFKRTTKTKPALWAQVRCLGLISNNFITLINSKVTKPPQQNKNE